MKVGDLDTGYYFVVASKGNNYLYKLDSKLDVVGLTVDVLLIDTTYKADKYFIGRVFTVNCFTNTLIVDHSWDKNHLFKKYIDNGSVKIII